MSADWLLDATPDHFDGMAFYRPFPQASHPGRGPSRNADRPILLCLPGYQDTARTFIFLEAVLSRFDPILLDWRGQGASTWRPDGTYTIQETFADLVRFTHAIVKAPFHVLGHSMGAALASRLAGLMPDRVRSLVLLEGFSGLLSAEEEVHRLSRWAAHVQEIPEPHRPLRSFEDVCRTLGRIHRGLRPDRLILLARLLSRPVDPHNLSAGYVWVHDPAIKSHTVPISFPPDVSRALWQRITAPGLLLLGAQSPLHPNRGLLWSGRSQSPGDPHGASPIREILSHFSNLECQEIPGAGHNLHHDAPDVVMPFLLDFYTRNKFL